MMVDTGKVISTILKHDAKLASYKIALLRAINDVVLSYPDTASLCKDVAVPLHILAEYWVAYYWPFVDPAAPIFQGPRSLRAGRLACDMSFREQPTQVRREWEGVLGGSPRPSDGFFIINDLRMRRRRANYPLGLLTAYTQAIRSIGAALEMPIRYAEPGQWSVFARPATFARPAEGTVGIPTTQLSDKCLEIPRDLWRTFADMSLWVEALSIHEWSLFCEGVAQGGIQSVGRVVAYAY